MVEENSDELVCPCCACVEFVPFRMQLKECIHCSLIVSERIVEPGINERMDEEWFNVDSVSESSFWVQIFERWNNKRTLSDLGKTQVAGKRLLEIGVGSGSFLAAARSSGYIVHGCDLSSAVCKNVVTNYGIEMHQGYIENMPVAHKFDVIVMRHVLEHVPTPIPFLAQAARLLGEGGVLYLAVPNVASWETILSGWVSYEPYHLTYFSPQTLAYLLNHTVFEIEKMKTHESFSGWTLSILRTLLRINVGTISTTGGSSNVRRPRLGIIEHSYRLFLSIVGFVSLPLRLLQVYLGYGDEIVCVSRLRRSSGGRTGHKVSQ